MHVSAVTIGWNLVLSAGKLAAGLLTGSGDMISDAVYSASDVFSAVIVMAGVKMVGKALDTTSYDNERVQCQLRQKIGAQPGVDRLSTRLFGDRVYVM